MSSIPEPAATAVADLLDECARLGPGQEVLIVAYRDGLRGGDNLVDEQAIAWIEAGVMERDASPTVLWADEHSTVHHWRFPPIVKAAMAASDVMINNTLDLSFEELIEFKRFTWDEKNLMVRNFATTASLLSTDWVLTPHRLVNEIRYRAATLIQPGATFRLTDANGTHLEGRVLPAYHPDHPWFTGYAVTREECGYYRPWPEWMHPPIYIQGTSGTFVFDRMLSWWSRYLDISPYFDEPIRLTIDDNRIVGIEGGDEAKALRRFLASMEERTGKRADNLDALHFGVHPNAGVTEEECPSILYRRLIEHAHTSNIHAHIGVPELTPHYPYWVHITGDIRTATFEIGETLMHDGGHLTVLDHPAVRAVAAEYPGRPGV
ncbi:MAG: hypothetical protein M1274_09210 [Actinobacteria bacterium]|nr:hypothetical protein [Actinomycetota bacterium]